jgi:hypothetical protein
VCPIILQSHARGLLVDVYGDEGDGARALLGKRQSVLVARDARPGAQRPRLSVAPARALEARAHVPADAQAQSAWPSASAEGRRLRDLRVARDSLLSRPQVSDPPLFGRSPDEAGTIMRVIGEFQGNAEPQINRIARGVRCDARARARRRHRGDACGRKRGAHARSASQSLRLDRRRAGVGRGLLCRARIPRRNATCRRSGIPEAVCVPSAAFTGKTKS